MKMEKNWLGHVVLTVWVCLMACPVLRAEEEALPVLEMSADRVTIYPQRMELNGEETLFDILQLYPAILTNAYDNWLSNYEIRIDNGPYGGDMRVLLNEMKAYRIKKVQISDNPGVAKGTTGMSGVVDVFLMPLEEGAHGTVSAELSQNVSTTPFAEFRYGSKNTDILANASYTFVPLDPYDEHHQHSNFHMVNQLGEKDQLVTYFTQSFERTNAYGKYERSSLTLPGHYRTDYLQFYGQLRNYHYFTPSMFLMSAVVYLHSRTPMTQSVIDHEEQSYLKQDDNMHVAAAVEEFNATFFDHLNLMAGVEADLLMEDDMRTQSYYIDYNWSGNRTNVDAYVELDYTFQKWRFTLGDRARYFRYFMNNHTYPNSEHLNRRFHNMLHASVIFTPHHEHQIQLAYAQKYFPASISANPQVIPIHEVKLGYNFARPNTSASLNAYYYRFTNDGYDYNIFQMDASARYHYQFFTLTGGVSVQAGQGYQGIRGANAAFRLTPIFDIPYGMQVKARTVFYTPDEPLADFHRPTLLYKSSAYNNYLHNKPVYADLQFTKFWPHLDLYALWHDIFNGSYGIATLGLRVKM